MRRGAAAQMRWDPRRPAPVTTWLCVAILAASVLASVAQRLVGVGVDALIYTVPGVLQLELWRLVSYPFVVPSALQLFFNLLFLYLLGMWFESTHGGRELLRFFALSSLAAGLLAVPLHLALRYLPLIADVPVVGGPGPALDAMLVGLALAAPDSTVFFGFVLPMRARTLVWLVIGLEVISGLMGGAASLSITLAGLAAGYLLVTGLWRPSRLLGRFRRRGSPTRRGLYVVPPKDRTLH